MKFECRVSTWKYLFLTTSRVIIPGPKSTSPIHTHSYIHTQYPLYSISMLLHCAVKPQKKRERDYREHACIAFAHVGLRVLSKISEITQFLNLQCKWTFTYSYTSSQCTAYPPYIFSTHNAGNDFIKCNGVQENNVACKMILVPPLLLMLMLILGQHEI